MYEYYDLAEEIIENPTIINEILDKRSNEEIERLYFTLKQMHEDIMGDISDVFKKEDKQKDEKIKNVMDRIYDEILDRREYEEEQEEMTPNEKEYEDTLVLIENAERRIEELEEERENTDDERIGEIDDLIQDEKDEIERLEEQAGTLKYRIEMEELGTSEDLENPSYIDALFEREKKSKEARDSGFEINEYGEIIRPAKQQTVDELKNMSEEELQGLIEKNNKTIEQNNKILKKSLVERILEQQKTISKQQEEILNLSSQKKEF